MRAGAVMQRIGATVAAGVGCRVGRRGLRPHYAGQLPPVDSDHAAASHGFRVFPQADRRAAGRGFGRIVRAQDGNRMRPSFSVASNAGTDQGCPSTGTTSVCPESITPGTSLGPTLANKLQRLPSSGSGTSMGSIPALRRSCDTRAMSSAFGVKVTDG